jgi:coproporphyrinogen III oxidase-like Fe-S oxidoreductase
MRSGEQRLFDRFFRSAPAEVDAESIRQAWLALPSAYQIDDRHLPLPVWARRGLTESGEQAWHTLRRDLGGAGAALPYCIYVHIPFCASRCAFCDCYSFAVRKHRERFVERYLDLLAQEMRLWSGLDGLAGRPVSTVHFGGGTPTFLDRGGFGRLVRGVQDHFGTDTHTEWALETTSSEFDDGMMSALGEWGFTRLHMGVQSLEDGVRDIIGRREPARVVLDKIARAVEAGWIVSVDLILGLPRQTLEGVVGDISGLEGVGVDGFSLYELQRSSRNRRFIARHGLAEQGRLGAYFLMQAASRLLAGLGYRKTLFNHFARERDTNLYFTFPERGEDCLALGTIADGVFGDYHYRHPEYKAYAQGVGGTSPGLEGGLRRTKQESQLFPLEVALLAARLPPSLFCGVLGSRRAERLLRWWQEATLVTPCADPDALALTGNGSWFVAQMMGDLLA